MPAGSRNPLTTGQVIAIRSCYCGNVRVVNDTADVAAPGEINRARPAGSMVLIEPRQIRSRRRRAM